MASKAREAFPLYLRTGRRARESVSALPPMEFKSSADHDPGNGRSPAGQSGATPGGQPHGSGVAQPSAKEADGARPGAASLRAADIAERRALGRHSAGECYRYVKEALLRAGAVSDYLPGVPAKNAGVELARRGFVNMLMQPGARIGSPYDAPIGSVLVYDPTPDAANTLYGHIEIRTKTGFASDYLSPNARTGPRANGRVGRQRALKGVWIKR